MLDAIASEPVDDLSDEAVRDGTLALIRAINRLQAELSRRLAALEASAIPSVDGCRTAKAWLRAFGRMSPHAAATQLRAARMLRELPVLAQAALAGEIGIDHVDRVGRLAERVGINPIRQVETALVELACRSDPNDVQRACDRVRAHVDPDGSEPDARADFARRSLTLSRFDGMLLVRGQLDPEGGAAVSAALDALMRPPATGDDRTAAQRRADALTELARQALAHGHLPTVGGVRPQVAVICSPANLSNRWHADAPTTVPVPPVPSPRVAGGSPTHSPPSHGPLSEHWPNHPLLDPAWLDWFGQVPDTVASSASHVTQTSGG